MLVSGASGKSIMSRDPKVVLYEDTSSITCFVCDNWSISYSSCV